MAPLDRWIRAGCWTVLLGWIAWTAIIVLQAAR